MRRLDRVLLRLYPFDYRWAFGAEMEAALADNAPARRWTEAAGLLRGAAAEWWAKLTTDPGLRARVVPDPRMMRPPGVPREVWFRNVSCSPDTSR